MMSNSGLLGTAPSEVTKASTDVAWLQTIRIGHLRTGCFLAAEQGGRTKNNLHHSPSDIQVTVQGAGLSGRNYLSHHGDHVSPPGVRN